mmetsp:Transcript_18440/g.47491  ORF Transcript_18440/g.47491 Transcript_18440/m.47491 type:complete len:201 (+) Transcript_18440:989-1591(+)
MNLQRSPYGQRPVRLKVRHTTVLYRGCRLRVRSSDSPCANWHLFPYGHVPLSRNDLHSSVLKSGFADDDDDEDLPCCDTLLPVALDVVAVVAEAAVTEDSFVLPPLSRLHLGSDRLPADALAEAMGADVADVVADDDGSTQNGPPLLMLDCRCGQRDGVDVDRTTTAYTLRATGASSSVYAAAGQLLLDGGRDLQCGVLM